MQKRDPFSGFLRSPAPLVNAAILKHVGLPLSRKDAVARIGQLCRYGLQAARV